MLQALLARLQEIDFAVSKVVYEASPFSASTLHLFGMTGEGYFWIFATLPIAYLCRRSGMSPFYEFIWTNLFLINLVDIVMIAVAKHYFSRPRPNYQLTNTSASFLGPDRYSFPSGHASRSLSIAAVMLLYQPSLLTAFSVVSWALATCVSRVFVGRHYVGDVAGGAVLAAVNYWLFVKWFHVSSGLHELWPFRDNFFLSRGGARN